MAAGRKGTGPYGIGGGGLHQIPARIHNSDWPVVKNLLERDGISFQSFVFAVIEAYIRRDQYLIRAIDAWKRENIIPRGGVSAFAFSPRERRGILDEIDGPGGEEG